MKINEVMKETGLTKKAIYYYENEGLIKPQKNPDNNYRNYTSEEVRTLIVINILRRLDVPIKGIGDIINNSASMKDILKEQLIVTNRKINMLQQNKKIMNDLITRDMEESDFTFNTLKEFNAQLDKFTESQGQVGKELEFYFPGTLGKTFAIFYNNSLNVPLDTEEKVSAWNELINKLDEMKEIDFPEDIKLIVDELYEDADGEESASWERINRQITDYLSGKPLPADPSGAQMAKEALVGYYANPGNQKKIEGYYKLQSFIINNLDVFMEIDKYISIINEDYNKNRINIADIFDPE